MDLKACVVILIDIPGITDRAKDPKTSSLMMDFHNLVQSQLGQSENLPNIEYAYVFNDSALLLSYGDGTTASFRAFLRDADRLKRKIDCLIQQKEFAPAYGIAVKGKAFPPHGQNSKNAECVERVTVLRTSSYAMANCFLIEKVVKQKIREKVIKKKSWYVDNRLKGCLDKRLVVPTSQSNEPLPIKLLPKNRTGKIHLIDGYLWNED